ncbi:MAG: hypothetical protein MI808_13440 [Pseudomonadales bacterium]|nr:hypothetical protein [Pseudomonadales bacterium]
MKISGARKIALIGVAASSISIAVAQESAQTAEMGQVQQDLENAKAAVEEAKDIAEQIILDAQKEANLILQNAAVNDTPVDLTPIQIQSSRVAVEISAGTIEEIATAIMPADWRVLVDVKDPSIIQKRFQYVSTKSRDQALRDLLIPAGLRHQYFFDLVDSNGAKSPLLVISSR